MKNAKIIIEGLDYNAKLSSKAEKIVRRLPIYEIYLGEKVIAKENAGVVKHNCDFMVYDLAVLTKEQKDILKEELKDTYNMVVKEITVDEKKDFKPIFFKKKENEIQSGNTIEYYVSYSYIANGGNEDYPLEDPNEFLKKYTYKAHPCYLSEYEDQYTKTPEEYVKRSLLEVNAPYEYYRLIGNLLHEIEQIIDPNEILELVKVSARTYAEPGKIKNRSK